MKKYLFLSAFMLAGIFITTAQQSRFGATAGYLSANSKSKIGNESFSASEGGFYLGLVGDFGVTETFHVQSEITYAEVNDVSFLQVPIFAKFYVSPDFGFNVQVGPQITYTLEEVLDDFTKLNLGLGGGLGYDITSDFFAELRYVFQLNNYYTGPGSDDFKSRINFLNIGIGYKF